MRTLLSAFLGLAVTGCGPTDEEINQRIDERAAVIVEAKLVEAKLIQSEEERLAEEAAETAKPAWVRSMDFLAKLDELMADYQPVLPDEVDNTDVLRCVTNYEMSVDRDLKSGARTLVKQAEASERAREKEREDFERSKWVQYRIDYLWEQRVGTVAVNDCWLSDHYGPGAPGPAGCWWGCGGPKTCPRSVCNYCAPCQQPCSMDNCYEWSKDPSFPKYTPKIRFYGEEEAPWHRYSQEGTHRYSGSETPAPPELMKRIESSGLDIPARFHCKVVDARVTSKHFLVECAGDNPSRTHIRFNAAPARMVHNGDVLSVAIAEGSPSPGTQQQGAAPFASVEATVFKDEISIERRTHRVWLIDADIEEAKFESLGECPTNEEILEAAQAQ